MLEALHPLKYDAIWRRTYLRAASAPPFTAAPLSGRTHVSADIKHVLSPTTEPQEPESKENDSTHPCPHFCEVSITARLGSRLLPVSLTRTGGTRSGEEWRTPGCRDFWGGIKWYSKYKKARRPSRTNENSTLKTKKKDKWLQAERWSNVYEIKDSNTANYWIQTNET